jgi:hypothetical protein
MRRQTERLFLQLAVGLACIVPLAAGGAGVLDSAAMLKDVAHPLPTDLDSHFRYLSGLLLGLGLAFAACVPAIERRGRAFRLLTFLAVVGGLARLVSLLVAGQPGAGHLFGLAMELGVVPALALWQARVERLFRTS